MLNNQPMWNGQDCQATSGSVVVGKSPKSTWWCAELEGERVPCVRVKYGDRTFYISNENYQGFDKVFNHHGALNVPHASIPVDDLESFIESSN